MSTDAARTFESFDVGETHRTSGRTITESDIRMFVGATGSRDPIHLDHEYAGNHPLVDGVVTQGTLTLAVTDGMVVEAIAGDAALSMNVGHDEVRYLAPVYPGDTLSARVEVVEMERRDKEWGQVVAKVIVVNQNETAVLTEKHRLLIATSDNSTLAG